MPDNWQRLHLANDGDIPPLLFKFSPTSIGYGFLMTDLNYIWSEHLDRRSLLKRALTDDTTIDPSEDPGQLKVLLQKIGEGLQNEPGSKTSLKPDASADVHALELTVTCELPAPLQPLIWRISLSKEPQSSTTDQLLLPFIKAEADCEARQRSLIEELNKKDWVLAKLFDKIETLGVDLSSIFPGVSGLRGGRNGPTLAQAAKYIKGLAPFNEQSWRDEASDSSSGAGLSASIFSQMSDSIALMKAPPDGWWKSISETDAKKSSAPQDGNKTKTSSKSKTDAMDVDTDAGSETGDDEFQRQETPPRFKKSKGPVQRPEPPRESKDQGTESDDDLEETRSPKRRKAEDRPAPAMRPKAAPPNKPKGLGTIGGKKQPKQESPTPKSPTPSPSPPAKQPAASKPEEDETTDDDEDLEPPPRDEAKEKKKIAPHPAPKSSRGLGVIGGKKQPEPGPKSPEQEFGAEPETRASQPPSQSTTEPQQSPLPQQAPQKKTIGRIGAIGGKAKAKPSTSEASTSSKSGEKDETDDDSSPVSRPKARPQEEAASTTKQEEENAPAQKTIKKAATSPEPERELTEEEKADRKREELKRQLAAKSKAPAKKKRRF
ncbi:XRCC4-like factor-domain-containing protein [Aspergillus filifer]